MEASLEVKLIGYTPNPDKICACAARQSHAEGSAYKIKMDKKCIKNFLSKIIKSGHVSVLEHASFTFAISGISRTCSHQLVRHRIASYTQQSQRYVMQKTFDYIIPKTIKRKDGEARKEFERVIEHTGEAYNKLIKIGIPKEDARFVLPNATETKIVVTMNARELLHFFKLRMSKDAQWEIRELAKEMLKKVKKVSPIIFSYAAKYE